MCGFLGIFGKEEQKFNTPERMTQIREALRHRGPDDFQTLREKDFQLAFWRLSIVDRAHGRQPMSSPDGRTIILYNGEVYNYKAIRTRLESEGVVFRTDCDTEVILYAYERWGQRCFDQFEGMYAILIVDKKRRKIVLARDRLGVKPLYFQNENGCLAVASEPKALFSFLNSSPKLDRTSLLHYLLFQTILGTKTLFEGISKVPPGGQLEFDLENPKLLGFHSIQAPSSETQYNDYASSQEAIRQNFLENVRLAIDTDLPLCYHLSGGLDSNLLVSLTRHLDPERKITCVTSLVDGKSDPEWAFIEEAARFHKADLEIADVTEKSFFENLDKTLFHLDEPTGDPGVIPQSLVNQLVPAHSKIVFSGQGLDEMFFGYTRDLASYLLAEHGPDALNRNHGDFKKLPTASQDFFQGWDNFLKPYSVTPPPDPTFIIFRKLCRFDPFQKGPFGEETTRHLRDLALDTYSSLRENAPTLNDFLIDIETKIQLPTLLQMEDRASMQHSIETRVPFCTSSVLNLARQIDARWKLFSGKPKGILRDAFSEIIPPPILERNQKVGRPIPLKKWLDSETGRPYKTALMKKRGLFQELFQTDFVSYALDNQNPYDRSAWAVLSLSRWIDLYNISIGK